MMPCRHEYVGHKAIGPSFDQPSPRMPAEVRAGKAVGAVDWRATRVPEPLPHCGLRVVDSNLAPEPRLSCRLSPETSTVSCVVCRVSCVVSCVVCLLPHRLCRLVSAASAG